MEMYVLSILCSVLKAHALNTQHGDHLRPWTCLISEITSLVTTRHFVLIMSLNAVAK
jgi:hypothetical protein